MAEVRHRSWWRQGLAVVLVALSGCSFVGQGFDPDRITQLVPGQTTMAEAEVILRGPPAEVYRYMDGAANALWYQGIRGPVDMHGSQSALLAFDARGRFVKVLNTKNIVLDVVAEQEQREKWAERFAPPVSQ